MVVKRHEQLVDVSAIKNFFGKNKLHLGERERRRLLPFNLVQSSLSPSSNLPHRGSEWAILAAQVPLAFGFQITVFDGCSVKNIYRKAQPFDQLVWSSASSDNMDSPSPVTLVQYCSSDFSDSGEPGVFRQSVYVRGVRSSSLSLSVLWLPQHKLRCLLRFVFNAMLSTDDDRTDLHL